MVGYKAQPIRAAAVKLQDTDRFARVTVQGEKRMSQPVAAGTGHRYSVVGAGAIGGTLAWHLAQGGHSVTLIDIDRSQWSGSSSTASLSSGMARSQPRSDSRRSR